MAVTSSEVVCDGISFAGLVFNHPAVKKDLSMVSQQPRTTNPIDLTTPAVKTHTPSYMVHNLQTPSHGSNMGGKFPKKKEMTYVIMNPVLGVDVKLLPSPGTPRKMYVFFSLNS